VSTAAQEARWQASTAALESFAPAVALELVLPDLAGIVPDNSDGEPAIYAHPWDTDDERAIARAAALDDPAGWVEVLIRKARDEDGNRIWHVAHKVYLAALPHDIVRRAAWAIMMGDPNPDPEIILGGDRG